MPETWTAKKKEDDEPSAEHLFHNTIKIECSGMGPEPPDQPARKRSSASANSSKKCSLKKQIEKTNRKG